LLLTEEVTKRRGGVPTAKGEGFFAIGEEKNKRRGVSGPTRKRKGIIDFVSGGSQN